jgi:hypothetical protein
VTLLALIVLTSPFAGASTTIVKNPPFTGATPFAHNASHVSSCHAMTTILVAPQAHVRTGKVVSESSAFAGANCGGGSYARIHTDAGFNGSTFHVSKTGAHQITFKWRVSGNLARSGSCWFVCGANVSLFANVFDNTTRSWVLGGSSPNDAISVVISSSHFSGNFSGSFSLIVHANLTSGHQYLLFSGLSTFASWNGNVKAGGSYQVDVGSTGHGAWLSSIRIV